jgi:hypothetical protein
MDGSLTKDLVNRFARRRIAASDDFCLLSQHGRIRRGCPRARAARARRGPAGSARGPESLMCNVTFKT